MSLYQKVRPKELSEIVGNAGTIKALEKMVEAKEHPHTILLYGPTGTGKTTVARILARLFGSTENSTFEVNASNMRGIDTVREIAATSALSTIDGGGKTYIVDECFLGNTQVLIDYDKAISIEKIFADSKITEVLSYDLEEKKIVKKKILRKIRKTLQGSLLRTFVKLGEKLFWIYSTPNHKFYVVGKGYVEAKNICSGDKLIRYDGQYCFWYRPKTDFKDVRSGICPVCGKYFDFLRSHVRRAHEWTEDEKKQYSQVVSLSRKMFYQTEAGAKHKEFLSESRKGGKNPVFLHDKQGLKKLIACGKSRWNNLTEKQKEEQILRFIQAPYYDFKPNKPESILISFNVPNVEYVGDGSFYKILNINGKSKRKNPDFVIRKRDESGKIASVRKFIEVMDLEYWHKEDRLAIEAGYEKAGFDVLVVDAARLLTEPNVCRGEIEAFANNEFAEVVDAPLTKSNLRRSNKMRNFQSYGKKFVYNLEVEDTHNYFALAQCDSGLSSKNSLPVLVSNCHQLTPAAQEAFLKVLEDHPPDVYFIFCTTEPKGLIPTIRNRCAAFETSRLGEDAILELLNKVCSQEKLEVKPEILQAVACLCEGSPRAALVGLESVLGISDLDAAITLLQRATEKDATIIELCKLMYAAPQIRRQKWQLIMKTFDAIEGEPEQIRKAILGYLYKKLIVCQKEEDALDLAKLLSIFSVSVFYGNKPQLGAMVAKACLGGN